MKYSRSLVATLLISGSLLNSVAPAFAQTVPLPAANSEISNTATASYEDPNTPNVPITTVSNTVSVKVAKVAGILVKEVGFTQLNPSDTFKPNETVYSNFEVTNTGNDGVQFKVPKLADVSANTTFVRVEYNTGTAAAPTWVAVTDANGTNSPTIAIGGVLQVRVVLTVNSNAIAGDDIITTLGNTSTPGLVNAERGVGTETIDGKDIYTVDVMNAGGVVALGGNAANGVRESSAQQKVKVNAVKQAFAIVTLTNDAPVPVAATNRDNIKYNISVTVPTTDPTGSGKVATDLAPTAIKLATNAAATGSADVNRVIISNPLPTGSTLTGVPTAPTGWTPVYAITAPGVPTVWSTVPPVDLTTVKQVGFIYEPTTATAPASVPAATGTSLPATSTPYTGFAVTLTTSGLGLITESVTVDGTTPTSSGAPDPTKPVTAQATNTVTTVRAATISALYNGPEAKPQATGPSNDNNKDFTNKSMQIIGADAVRNPAGVLNKTTTSSVVTFNNTVENATNVAGDVYLLPTPPTTASDLPSGTIVKVKNINGLDTRSYTYNGTTFSPIAAETSLLPLKLAIAGNGLVSYALDVTLPTNLDQLKGYPVPVTAFTGGATPAVGTTTVPIGAVQNMTIDRVYTGYIDLKKEARVFDVITDQTVSDTVKPYASAPTVSAVPGKFIQYRIRAVNVSEDLTGGSVDSKTLQAGKVKMLEDGAALPNNWASTTSHAVNSAATYLGTTLLPSSTITYDQGAKLNSQPNVSRYDVNLGATTIAPQQTGSFVFVRQVNKTP